MWPTPGGHLMDPLIVLFGLGVGLLVGTTGVGGGSLMTPLLILVFGIKPTVAIGTDLAYAAVTKTVGGWRHFRNGTVNMGISLWLAVGSVPGALGGVYVLRLLEDAYGAEAFDSLLLELVAAALLVTGLAVIGRILFSPASAERERDSLELTRRYKAAAVTLGLTVGFVLGLTSAGSGSLIAVGLILIFRLTQRRIVGTDVFHAAILLWVAAIAHLISGNVDLSLAGNILIGSIPGVWIGSGLAVRLPEGALRPTLAVVLLAAGLALLNKAGVGFPIALIFIAPLVAAAGLMLLHVLRSRSGRVHPAPEPT
ncbi:MAG: sulfite exporter TauE/SafE family protein [Solirubrobacteraceae bacterium]